MMNLPKASPFFVIVSLLLTTAPSSFAQTVADPPKADFDRTGPQPGEQVPDLHLHTMKGEEQRLSAAWSGGPALLVTSSLTCPKSRSRWPELKALVEKYEDKLNVVIIYVIEAHPVGSPCPYKGVEDITPENQRDGILRKQPKSLEDRLELAAEFKRLLRVSTPVYVDNIKDEAWKGLGAAPNLALLVDETGIVVSRSGWFEGTKSQEAIDKYLQAKVAEKKQEEEKQSRWREDFDAMRERHSQVYEQLEKAGLGKVDWGIGVGEKAENLPRILKAAPQAVNLVYESSRSHPYDSTLLMNAVLARNAEAVKVLLSHGADVKASTRNFDSALQIAAENGEVAIGKLLLANGADPAFPVTGKSPLHEAALHGHAEFVKLLLTSGVRHDLFSAVSLGETELVRKGLKADPSRAMRPDGADRDALDYAAANGQLDIAKLLVAHGALLVQAGRSRLETPLHRAIARDDAAFTEWLLSVGSSPNTVVGHGGEYPSSQSALHLAIARKNLAIVKILLAHKVDLTARDTYSQTALHDAASLGQAEIVAALLQGGADVNIPQLGYETPCGSGSEKTPSYTTPLHFAASATSPATLKVLIAAGAKVNAVTKYGKTPLMNSVSSRRYANEQEESRLANVEFLLASGADINAEDKEGRSVLDVAIAANHGEDPRSRQDHEEMIALLKKHGAKPGSPKAAPGKRIGEPTPAPGEVDPFGG